MNANPTTEVTTLYGVPVRQVFRLIRVICSWNLELSQRLTSDNRILDAIISYTAMDVSELNLPTQEGLLLILESSSSIWNRNSAFYELLPCLDEAAAVLSEFCFDGLQF